jgi:acyl-coenzyme A thioesterase PaaI-like protein
VERPGVTSGEAQPAPAVTSQISLRLTPMLSCTALVVSRRVLRKGRASVVLVVDVVDSDTGTAVGAAVFTAAVLQGGGGSHQAPKDPGRQIIWRRQAEATGRVATDDYLDMHAEGQDGSAHLARLALHDKLLNVSDVLHGGAAMLITEQAALLAARAHGASSPVVDDLDVHFLAPGQAGPLMTRTVVVGTYGRRLNLAVELVDDAAAAGW